MAWSWSHTNAGIQAARDNFFDLPPEELREIWTEWRCMQHANQCAKLKHAVDKWCEEATNPIDDFTYLDNVVDTYADDYETDYDAYSSHMYDHFCKEWDNTVARLGQSFVEHYCESMCEWIEELATCGFNCWVCPTGCHTVPFDRENNDEAGE